LADARDGVGITLRLGAVGTGPHVVERWFAGTGAWHARALRERRLHGLVLALDAGRGETFPLAVVHGDGASVRGGRSLRRRRLPLALTPTLTPQAGRGRRRRA